MALSTSEGQAVIISILPLPFIFWFKILPEHPGYLSRKCPGLIAVCPAHVLIIFGKNAEDIRVVRCIYQQYFIPRSIYTTIFTEDFNIRWYLRQCFVFVPKVAAQVPHHPVAYCRSV